MSNHLSASASEKERVFSPFALIVEDLPDIREWLGFVLEQAFEGIQVVKTDTLAAARNWLSSAPRETIARTRIALVDLGLPDGSGIGLIKELSEQYPNILPVVATIFDDDAHLFDSIAAGAQGYILKGKDAPMLVEYLLRIERGEPPLSPAMARRMMSHFRQQPKTGFGQDTDNSLTPREAEILTLLGNGSRPPEAARQLGLSENAVVSYVREFYCRLKGSARPRTETMPLTGWRSRLLS